MSELKIFKKSELKIFKQSDVLWGHWFTEYYLKSDVDTVIEEKDRAIEFAKALTLKDIEIIKEKDKEIAELNDKLQNVSSLLKETREWLVESQKLHKRCADNAVKVIRHQKYKRCLAMAWWCEATALWCYQAANTLPAGFHASLHGKPVMIEPERLFKRSALLTKWNTRWLELAEKFKHNKEMK